ncbi:MAG: response regulator [Cyanosarcina radialis HA8281-LM2]|jgi:hypothetical protein|nr:response regulator [Cyanosarcina radialis HA8281-LM2]
MPPHPNISILLVDDKSENLLALEAILNPLGQTLVKASSGQEALRHLLHQDFALILLDVQMPGMDGFETATLIRQRSRSRSTPIIFLTAFDTDKVQIFRGYSLGAVDYLIKPFDPDILKSKVSVFVELHQKNIAIQQQAAQLAALNAQLTASEERFRLLSACSPIGIFLTDTTGCLTYTNPRCQELWNWSLDCESRSTGWLHRVYPDDRSWTSIEWTTALHTRQPFEGEFRFLLEDNREAWVHLRAAPLISEQRAFLGYVGTIEDITGRKQAEIQQAQLLQEQIARQEAEAANRLKDEFLMVLSHELRTPLSPILTWSQILQTRNPSADKMRQGLTTIERNAKLQLRLIEDILDVSRIIQGKLKLTRRPIGLIAVVKEALATVRFVAESKGIDLQLTIPKPDLNFQVDGDPARLQQVISNLLNNAIKFTPEGGRVEVQIDTVEEESQMDEGTNSTSGREKISLGTALARVTVTDTGKGISPTFLPYIFDRFRQADSSSTRPDPGLGLGLAIARHLVELHDGTIHAASPGEDRGATFTVRLPLLPELQRDDPQEQQVSVSVESFPTSTANLDGVSVLVVDDADDTREVLEMALKDLGATVTVAASADEALAAFKRQPPHILISDIGMPDRDGYDLIGQIRALDALSGGSIPAIALTGYAGDKDRQRAIAAGFQKHLSKPIDPQILAEVVTSLIEKCEVLSVEC